MKASGYELTKTDPIKLIKGLVIKNGYSSRNLGMKNGYSSRNLRMKNRCSSRNLRMKNGLSSRNLGTRNRVQQNKFNGCSTKNGVSCRRYEWFPKKTGESSNHYLNETLV